MAVIMIMTKSDLEILLLAMRELDWYNHPRHKESDELEERIEAAIEYCEKAGL